MAADIISISSRDKSLTVIAFDEASADRCSDFPLERLVLRLMDFIKVAHPQNEVGTN